MVNAAKHIPTLQFITIWSDGVASNSVTSQGIFLAPENLHDWVRMLSAQQQSLPKTTLSKSIFSGIYGLARSKQLHWLYPIMLCGKCSVVQHSIRRLWSWILFCVGRISVPEWEFLEWCENSISKCCLKIIEFRRKIHSIWNVHCSSSVAEHQTI